MSDEDDFADRFLKDDPSLSNDLIEDYQEIIRKRRIFYLLGIVLLVIFFIISQFVLQNLFWFFIFFIPLSILMSYLFYVLEGEYNAHRTKEEFYDK